MKNVQVMITEFYESFLKRVRVQIFFAQYGHKMATNRGKGYSKNIQSLAFGWQKQ